MNVCACSVARHARRRVQTIACALALAALGASAATEDPGAAADTLSLPSAEAIQARLDAIKQDPNLDETTKTQFQSIYTQTLEQLRVAGDWASKTAAFDEILRGLPDELKQMETDLAAPIESPESQMDPTATQATLEQQLATWQSELANASAARSAIEDERARRTERRKQLPDLIASTRHRLLDLRAQADARPTTGLTPELIAAQRDLDTATQVAIENEIAAYDKELQSFDQRGQRLKLRLDLAMRDVARLEALVNAYQEVVEAGRWQEAQETVRQTTQVLDEVTEAPPEVRIIIEDLAKETNEFVERRTGASGVLHGMEKASRDQQTIQVDLKSARESFDRIRQRVDAVGLNNAIGRLLRKQKAEFVDTREHRRDIDHREDEMAEAELAYLDIHEDWLRLTDNEAHIREAFAAAAEHMTKEARAKVDPLFQDVMSARHAAIESLVNDYTTYFNKLVDLDADQRQLVDESERFADYIDERILWIRSSGTLGMTDLGHALTALTWLLGPQGWLAVLAALGNGALLQPVATAAVLAILAGLYWFRRREMRRLAAFAEAAKKRKCTSMRPTVEALATTILALLFWPLVAYVVGWSLATTSSAPVFVRGVGQALQAVALVALGLETVRHLVRPQGLGDAHFDWSAAVIEKTRRHLRWLEPAVLVSVFALSMLEWQREEAWQESLGRIILILFMASSAVMTRLVLHAAPKETIRSDRNRLESLWPWLVMLIPVGLLLLAWSGYNYTALRLSTRLLATAGLLLVLLLVRALALRWLLLTRRHLAIERVRKRREADPVADEEELDLARLDLQTNRLTQGAVAIALLVGVWFIWTNELPALRVLDRVTIWQTTQTVNQTAGEDEAKTVRQTVEVPVPVSLGDLCFAMVIVLVTLIATANIPGLLELAVLQRTQLGRGERYAITTLVRYVIILLGIAVAFNTIGVGWSNIQWLVAAVGLGLGFGLQEIFANFVSGVILLFERPIRINDVVTVGGVSGTVSKIRIRSTWITDFDRKELVVPNKEFVTNQLVNWTLSDSTLRAIIPVGIAYGSDTALAERTLYEVAGANPHVLADPAPVVLFMGFGASSLDFELRVFCKNVNMLLSMRHQLHMAIDQAFRERGIEIAFPQQDVRIRSIDGILPVQTSESRRP
ncbi:MAG TPA: mechanosensitive ion channel [Candidatus Hydrogenedentes bacterium]|nr:mechanosensitive ion channel [Candidatus Hydrogenedentota bacterium]HPG68168.1 mechanosensitive ion channel [Candidatus Hydrogenedentota bacterium]